MSRTVHICLFASCLLCATLATRGLYALDLLTYSAADSSGHGPDYGTAEWESGRLSSIWTRSVIVGLIVLAPLGIMCFCKKRKMKDGPNQQAG
jgi:hypothetical protein